MQVEVALAVVKVKAAVVMAAAATTVSTPPQ